jgi:hypothetical protein
MSALSYIIEVIREKQKQGIISDEVYFRGQREKHVLVPSLLRNNMHFKKLLAETENNFFCDAWVMGAKELSYSKSSWEALALFQHYEIPTRLLDWSSALTSALFFALQPCLKCKNTGTCNKLKKSCQGNPTIWVLDPYKMHHKLYPADPIKNQISITVGIDPIQDYKEEFILKGATNNNWNYKNGPVFLEIPWTDARMRSQKGFFTFHSDERPLDTLIDETGGLVKIIINKRHRGDIVNEFSALGITEHDIFTDLVSLANYFKRRYTNI